MISFERASQEEQNGANFSFIAPSSEELWVFEPLYISTTVTTFTMNICVGSHNSSQEGAMKVKFVPFCSS